MTASRRQGDSWALGGILFAVFFILGDVLRGVLANDPLPLPGAPAVEAARYFTENQTAVLAVALCQVLAALSLFVFVAPVAAFVRRTADERGALPGLVSGGGVLSAVLLLASALLGLVLALTAAGLGLGLVDTLRQANFLTGGTLHVASLGLFVGAASIAAAGGRRCRAGSPGSAWCRRRWRYCLLLRSSSSRRRSSYCSAGCSASSGA
jgi:hypothetical protein